MRQILVGLRGSRERCSTRARFGSWVSSRAGSRLGFRAGFRSSFCSRLRSGQVRILPLCSALLTALFATPQLVAAGEFDLSAELSADLRLFPNDALLPEQFDHVQPSIVVEPELLWQSESGKHQVAVLPFFRWDGQDDERTHGDIREGYYRYNSDKDWSLTLGAAKVFWGRTESRHLVDIINQTDAVEDIDEEDKLGQPMVYLSFLKDWGTVDLFLMSGFRDRTFAGVDGRPRFTSVIDTDNPIFTRDARRGAVDIAARYSHYIGEWDFGISVFHGTSREPRFAPAFNAPTFLPVYDLITQGGVDLQYTKDAWLWKFEAIVREGQGDTFFAAVGGFEYTVYQVLGSNADLGLLTEYQFDGRDDGFIQESFGPALAAPVTIAENDVFMGARLAFNDTQNTALLVGGTIDVEDQSTAMFIEAERSLGEDWFVSLQGRLFLNIAPDNILFNFRDDDFLNFRLTRYF
ncbi:MAG: hypothetical protein AAF720_13800 [Pseudomonadota bacterium]